MSDRKRPVGQNWMMPWLWPWAEGGSNVTNFPSGDVSQAFRFLSPNIEVNGKGDPELEARIVRDVATYGAQLGQLTEIVLALADGKSAPKEATAKLREIAAGIAELKQGYTENALARARAALDDLKARDQAGYELLVTSLDRKKG